MKILALFLITLLWPSSLHAAPAKANICNNLKASAQKSLAKLGLDTVSLKADCDDLIKQVDLDNAIAFQPSLDQALHSFLNDYNDIESPLAISIAVAIEENEWSWTEPFPKETIDAGKRVLLQQLGNGAVLSVVTLEDAPEMGESTVDSWVFKLKLPSLSDHIYWAIVDRDGLKPVYNYGFN